MRCRQQGKPVIVASHLLQSMHQLPTPTRAEVRAVPAAATCALHQLQGQLVYPRPRSIASHLPACRTPHGFLGDPPSQFQVSDIADCVRQRADALMLCGETAAGGRSQQPLEPTWLTQCACPALPGTVALPHGSPPKRVCPAATVLPYLRSSTSCAQAHTR